MKKLTSSSTIDTINAIDFQQTAEEMAKVLEKISKGVQSLFKSRLTDELIILLISKASGESIGAVSNVIYGMKNLSKKYIKPQP